MPARSSAPRTSAIRRAPGRAGRRRRDASTSDSSTSRSACTRCGDQRGQPVVVAEPDLVGGDGVVLVDDGDDAEVEQPGQRAAARCGSGRGGSRRRRSAAPARPSARAGREGLGVAATSSPARPLRPPAAWRGHAAGAPARAAPGRRRSRRRTRARPRAGLPAGRRARRRARRPAGRRARRPGRQRRRADLDDHPLGAAATSRRIRRLHASATLEPQVRTARTAAARRRSRAWAPSRRRPRRRRRRCSTSSPATAPARDKASSTPEPGQPVGEVADGLVVGEVGLAHPALGLLAAHPEAAPALRVTVNPASSTAFGRSTIRVASGSACAARACVDQPRPARTKLAQALVGRRATSKTS